MFRVKGLLFNIYARAFVSIVKRPPHFAVFLNYLRYYLNLATKKSVLTHYPPSVVLYATKRCNLNCEFCFVKEELNSDLCNEYDLSLDQLKEIAKTPYFKRALRVGLLGGEPTINKDFIELLKFINSEKKVSTVVTNGIALDGELLDQLEKNPPSILGLSLYSSNHKAVERIYKRLSSKCIIWVQTIIEANNLEYVREAANFCVEIGCPNLALSNYYPHDEASYQKMIIAADERYLQIKEAITREFEGKLNIDWAYPVDKSYVRRDCKMPFNYIHLDNKGNIGGCCMRAPDRKLYGNVFHGEGWNTEEMIRLRRTFLDNKMEPTEQCKNCENFGNDLYKI